MTEREKETPVEVKQMSLRDCLFAIRQATTNLGCRDEVGEINAMCDFIEEIDRLREEKAQPAGRELSKDEKGELTRICMGDITCRETLVSFIERLLAERESLARGLALDEATQRAHVIARDFADRGSGAHEHGALIVERTIRALDPDAAKALAAHDKEVVSNILQLLRDLCDGKRDDGLLAGVISANISVYALRKTEKLREALRKYGEHRSDCALGDSSEEGCTCGLTAIRAGSEAAAPDKGEGE